MRKQVAPSTGPTLPSCVDNLGLPVILGLQIKNVRENLLCIWRVRIEVFQECFSVCSEGFSPALCDRNALWGGERVRQSQRLRSTFRARKLQLAKARHSLEWPILPLTWAIRVGKVATSLCVSRNSIGSGGEGVGECAVCLEMMMDI